MTETFLNLPLGPQRFIQSIMGKSYDVFNLDGFRVAGVLSPKNMISMQSTMEIPDLSDYLTLVQAEEEISWSFDLPDDMKDSISVSTSKKSMPRGQKYKLRHEFVAEALMGPNVRTDVRLDSVFSRLNDDDDVLSPDCYFEDPLGIRFIIEIGTTRSVNKKSIARTFEEKHFKYEQALSNRSLRDGVTTVYIPIIISNDEVYSNIRLSEDLITELLIRMRIAITLENMAIDMGFTLCQTDQEEAISLIGQDIQDELNRIHNKERKDAKKVFITNDFIERALGDSNLEKVFKSFQTSMEQADIDMTRMKKHVHTSTEYEKLLADNGKKRKDLKPIILFPGILPSVTSPSTVPLPKVLSIVGVNREMDKLWKSAFDCINCKKTEWHEEKTEDLLKEAYELRSEKLIDSINKRHLKRSKYHVVDLKEALTNKTVMHLAKDGVLGKSMADKIEIKEVKERKKLPYSLSINTDDITSFISSDQWLEPSHVKAPESTEMVLNLIQAAHRIAGNYQFDSALLKQWTNTKLFRYMDFISDIAIELAVSFKTNLSRSKFIVKKLRHHNAYILIKPTNSRSHMFYSLLIPMTEDNEDLPMGPYAKSKTSGNCIITEFNSVREDKIENLATLSSSLLAFVAFWAHFYNLDAHSVDHFKRNSEARKMLLITMLIKMEDKAETEESITLTRYMYMELFKGNASVCRSDPFKILSKFTTKPRSRLNVYVINNILRAFKGMMEVIPRKENPDLVGKLIEGEDCLPDDEWSNLVNFFTGSSIASASKVINLCYLGYVKNKNEVGQENSSFKLMEKILNEELSIDLNNMKDMEGDMPANVIPGPKKFNLNCVVKGCQLMEKKIKNALGPSWKTILEREIVENLARSMTDELASLKASSPFDHGKMPGRVTKENNIEFHRLKVIEALAIHLNDFGINPYVRLNSIIEYIEKTTGGVVCDLFKKNQHGGLREIYVLTIHSRIVQLFIEVISRTLCSYFEEETLTHPNNKLSLLDKHKVRSGKLGRCRNSVYADFCSSSDKKRWNQNFVMPVMSVPLLRMTTSTFHNAIQRIMNLWADKLIKIPPSVCSLLLSRVRLSSEEYESLLLKFWRPFDPSISPSIIRHQCEGFVNTTSGMMQGILHYCSSLLHLTFLHVGTYCITSFLKRSYPDYKFTMTQVCSSDDSATILSVISPINTEIITIRSYKPFYLAEKLLLSLTHFCKFFCMRESEKSTIAMPDYVEFNSEFIFKNTVAKPLIKLTAAATGLTESESFIDRFHTMYNLISDLYTSGMDSYNCSFTQIGQAWIHYKTMGASCLGVFREYYDKILLYPHPSMGFFGFDSELLCGFAGFSFVMWTLLNTSRHLRNGFEFISAEEMQVSNDGSVTTSLSVKHGDYKKWHLMMDRIVEGKLVPRCPLIKVDPKSKALSINEITRRNRHNILDSNLELLFRPAQNKHESRIKLLYKASMPGVGKSLGRGNPFMQSLSMSVYSIYTHCLTRSSVTQDIIEGNVKLKKNIEKMSLLMFLDKEIERSMLVKEDDFDEETFNRKMELCFPLHDRYKEIQLVLHAYADIKSFKIHRIRQRKSIIVIQPSTHDLPLSLFKVVGKLWFSIGIRATERMYRRCLDSYRVLYPWLLDTMEDSIHASPFSTPMELYNFVSKQSGKSRKLSFTGPGIFSNFFDGQIKQLIQKNYKAGHITQIDDQGEFMPIVFSEDLSNLSLALQIPISSTRNELVTNLLSKYAPFHLDAHALKLKSRRTASMMLLGSFTRGDVDKTKLIDILNETRIGTIISFTKEQTREMVNGRVNWVGTGEALVQIESHFFKITMEDRYATRIVTSNWDALRRDPGAMRMAMELLGLSAQKKSFLTPGGVARFQGTRFVPISSFGTPIILDKDLESLYLTPKNIHFKIFRGRCGMYMKMKGGYQPIVEIKSLSKDMPPLRGNLEGESIWKHWTDYSPCSTQKAHYFCSSLKTMIDKKGPTHPDVEPIIMWLQNTLLNRLKFRGIGYVNQDFTTSIADSEDPLLGDIDSDDMDWLEELIDEDIKGDVDGMMFAALAEPTGAQNDEEEPMMELLEEFNRTDHGTLDLMSSMLHNWQEEEKILSKSIMRREAFDYLYMHPLWDNFIDDVQGMDPNFYIKLLQGIISENDPTLSNLLMTVLRIEVKRKELNITNRFGTMKQSTDESGLEGISMEANTDLSSSSCSEDELDE